MHRDKLFFRLPGDGGKRKTSVLPGNGGKLLSTFHPAAPTVASQGRALFDHGPAFGGTREIGKRSLTSVPPW